MSASHCLVIALALALPLSAPAQPGFHEGEWQTTVKMEMQGIPVEMPPLTSSQCLTRKDLVPKTQQPGQDCRLLKRKITGDTVSWEMECKSKDGGTMRGRGEIAYRQDSYSGTLKMEFDESGVPRMTMNYALTGRRVGPCKK